MDTTRKVSFYAIPLALIALFAVGCSPTPVEVLSVDGPDQLEAGEAGTFEAEVNQDAERPIEYRWDFGDGATGAGLMASHAFDAEGEYTVTFTASNEAGSASEQLTVEVVPPPQPAAIAAINATPSPAEAGQQVRFSSNVRGDQPISYQWDFGDGASATGASPSHTFEEAGTYEVALTASNEVGEDRRTMRLEVEPALAPICMEVSELNGAFFDRNSSTLTAEGRSQLQENLDILSQCPNLSVRVEGYSSPFERNAEALSEDRARAVAQFYREGGVPGERVTAEGMGAVEGVTSKKGGTDQFRRVDSVLQREEMSAR